MGVDRDKNRPIDGGVPLSRESDIYLSVPVVADSAVAYIMQDVVGVAPD